MDALWTSGYRQYSCRISKGTFRISYPNPYSAPPSMHTPQLPCLWGVASWPTLTHSWSMNGVHSLTQQMFIGHRLCALGIGLRYWRHHRIRQTLFLSVRATLKVVNQVIELQSSKGTEGTTMTTQKRGLYLVWGFKRCLLGAETKPRSRRTCRT